MKSKLIPIAYTVAVIKPNIALKEEKMQEVMKTIEDNNFEIFHQKQKVLRNEEILNLFYKYRNQDFYDDIKEHLTAGESKILLLINKVETTYDEEKEEEVKLEDPITRWKKLIGPSDPEEAKGENENCLRALYGEDLIRNGFHGSDDPRAANKERDIFKFSIPEKIPEFKYERYKVTMDHLLRFCYPPNLEHSDVTGRLDLFALYGPTVDYHSVDSSFCNKCIKIAKACLRESIAAEEAKERKERGGGTGSLIDPSGFSGSGINSLTSTKKSSNMTKNLGPGPRRLLREEDIDLIRDDLCK